MKEGKLSKYDGEFEIKNRLNKRRKGETLALRKDKEVYIKKTRKN